MKYYLYNKNRYFTGSKEYDEGIRPLNGTIVPPNNEPNQKWMGNEWKNVPMPQLSFEKQKVNKIAKVVEIYEKKRVAVSAVPSEEKATWDIQKAEYEAYMVDNNALTPVIDMLVQGDNDVGGTITKEELMVKIGNSIQAYINAIAFITGQQHGLERRINATTTLAELAAVKVKD